MELSLEERVRTLEEQVTQLLAQTKPAPSNAPWWQQRFGAFKDDEIYEAAMELGAQYRRSQPTAADEIEALEKAGVYVPLPHGQ